MSFPLVIAIIGILVLSLALLDQESGTSMNGTHASITEEEESLSAFLTTRRSIASAEMEEMRRKAL